MVTVVDESFEVEMSLPFAPEWGRIPGLSVDGLRLRIDPAEYFFERSKRPTWMLVDWDRVVEGLLPLKETETAAVEQQALEFVHKFGQRTEDPAAVLRTADQVYSFVFGREVLDDPALGVTALELRILRESATIAALNRVELSGEIADMGPAWLIPAVARVVFDLDTENAERIDDLYHGTWFNEYRRVQSVKAHAALGGRLVHGCQSSPNLSGGTVAPYGVDLDRLRADLDASRQRWISSILALAGDATSA